MDLAALRRPVQGRVVARGEPGFEDLTFGTLWNRRHPTDRTPEEIVRVAGDDDVAEAVRAARAGGLRVTVRGGGHNWCSPSLRGGGMLVDLTDLTQVLEVDAEARTAVTEPIVSNRDMQALLNAQGAVSASRGGFGRRRMDPCLRSAHGHEERLPPDPAGHEPGLRRGPARRERGQRRRPADRGCAGRRR